MKMPPLFAFALPLLVAGVPAFAVEFPLAGTYGNKSGCTVAAEGGYPESRMVAIESDVVLYDAARCPITGFSESESADGAAGWEVNIACEFGHEDVQYGTLAITETGQEGAKNGNGLPSISVVVLSGVGPEGDYPLCETDS